MHIAIALLTAAVAASGPAEVNPAEATGLCTSPEFVTAFEESDLLCMQTDHGLAIAPADEVELYSDAVSQGWESFSRYFAEPGQDVAVVPRNVLTDEQTQFLESKGYSVFGWFSNADVTGNAEIAASVKAQLGTALPGMAESELESRASAAVKRMVGSRLGALPHELSHFWFKTMYDGSVKAPNKGAYASTAPDWLDEIAAVMAEDAQRDQRNVVFRIMESEGIDGLISLDRFFSMIHPRLEAGLANAPEPGQKGMVVRTRVRTMGAEEAYKDPAIVFYAQVRNFADFMIEESGDDRIFAHISDAMKSGRSMDEWLATHGADYGLPDSVTALSLQWEEWLTDNQQGWTTQAT